MRKRFVPFCSFALIGCGTSAAEPGPVRHTTRDTMTCADGEVANGCPCAELEPVVCYEGPTVTQDVAPCTVGIRSCAEGRWTRCEGQVLPSAESCNEVDDDCDGAVDEDDLNACGTCDPVCDRLGFGHESGQTRFDPEEGNCVELEDDGDLTSVDFFPRFEGLWIANTGDGTISAVDSQGRVEAGRYRTGPLGASDAPSATSVLFYFDALVANRAPGGQASVTRVYGDDCVDADGDGVVETSSGRDDVLPWGADECVVWNLAVGAPGAIAGALAAEYRVGLDGFVAERAWVGLEAENRYLEIDATSGEATGRDVDLLTCSPSDAAIDRDGSLWSACRDAQIAHFDTEDGAGLEILDAPGSGERIMADENGFVWTAGAVARLDPESDVWDPIPGVTGAGMATDDDDAIWVGECARGGVFVGTCRIDGETLEVEEFPFASRAVAADSDGFMWGISPTGIADVWDPWEDTEAERVLDDCEGPDGACLAAPDPHGDLATWNVLRMTPSCEWGTVVSGCGGGRQTTWATLDWEAEVPEGSVLMVNVRTADTLANLGAAPWAIAGSQPPDDPSIDLRAALSELGDEEAVHADFLEFRVEFRSAGRGGSPVLHDLGVWRSCR